MRWRYCRRLGEVIRNRFGEGNDPIWLDEVNCAGDERSLAECGHDPWGQNDCSHSEDVAIACNMTISVIRKSRFCLSFNACTGTLNHLIINNLFLLLFR